MKIMRQISNEVGFACGLFLAACIVGAGLAAGAFALVGIVTRLSSL